MPITMRRHIKLRRTLYMWYGKLAVVRLSSVTVLDSELSFEQHASKLTQTCFFHLRRLRAIRRSLTNATLLTLVHAFIATRLDYCNSALFGCERSVSRAYSRLLSSADTEHFQVWANHYNHAWYATLVTSAPAHRVQDLYARPQLCQRVSTDIFTGDLQFSQRRCTSTASWPRDLIVPRANTDRFGRRGFSVSGPNQWNKLAATWHSESVR